ncbi:MAG TPA: DUF4258 domain-containing protein [Candidatus Hydrogenedentes bacterium]|nr:DUF4258 domain-containing protein [Candidatus Hydrogenedentota bacterium]
MKDNITSAWISERIHTREYLISRHAEDERRNDGISLSELERVLLSGQIIEHYEDTGRGSSCLVCGRTIQRPIHVVCGRNKHSWLIIITVYIPSLPKWKTPTERNR